MYLSLIMVFKYLIISLEVPAHKHGSTATKNVNPSTLLFNKRSTLSGEAVTLFLVKLSLHHNLSHCESWYVSVVVIYQDWRMINQSRKNECL